MLPDTAVTALVVDLLRDVVDSLPGAVQPVAQEVLQQLYPAIYCEAGHFQQGLKAVRSVAGSGTPSVTGGLEPARRAPALVCGGEAPADDPGAHGGAGSGATRLALS